MSIGFTEPTFATDLNKFIFVNMFLGCTPPDIKAKIVRQKASLRIIFVMSSFGMGVDCSGIQQVIHIGVTTTIYSRNRERRS